VQSCAEAGVLGVLPGLIGTMQATEALKLILGIGEPLVGRLLLVDAMSMRFRTIALERDAACPACGTGEIRSLGDYDAFCDVGSPDAAAVATIDPRSLARELANNNAITVIDVREPYEWSVGRIPTATLIPLATIGAAAAARTIDPAANVVVYCHHGVRSEMAARILGAAGYSRVRNLIGGIDRWSVDVDSRVPRY
jgi:adenylyltransferase/sulfurtransferase